MPLTVDPATISVAEQVGKAVRDVGIGSRALRVGALVGIPIVVVVVVALSVAVVALVGSSALHEARPEYFVLPR